MGTSAPNGKKLKPPELEKEAQVALPVHFLQQSLEGFAKHLPDCFTCVDFICVIPYLFIKQFPYIYVILSSVFLVICMCFTHDTYSFESVILLSVFLLPELSDTFLIKYLTNVGVLCGPKSLCLLVFTEHKLPECDICLASYLPPYCPNMVTSGFKTPTFQWPEHKIQMQNQR